MRGVKFTTFIVIPVSSVRGRKKKNEADQEVPILSAEQLKDLLNSMHGRLFDDQGKASVADFIRLFQLYQEMRESEPKEIHVRWVNSTSSIET